MVLAPITAAPGRAALPADAMIGWGDTVTWSGGPLTGHAAVGNHLGDMSVCVGPACEEFLLDVQVAPSSDPDEVRFVHIEIESTGAVDIVVTPPGGDPAFDYQFFVARPGRLHDPEPGVWRVTARCFDACLQDTYTMTATTGSLRRPRAVAHTGDGIPAPDASLDPRGEMYDVGSSAWEPTLGVAADGTILYQAVSVDQVPRVMRSADGGETWRDASPRSDRRRHGTTLDPYIYVDPLTDRVFTIDFAGCHAISFSDDLGGAWTTSAACGPTDFQKLVAGPPMISATIGYPNVVYLCAINGGTASTQTSTAVLCSKSLDGGITWIPTGTPPFHDDLRNESGTALHGHCGGGAPPGAVGPDGTFYVARSWCGKPTIAISHDEGATWERHRISELQSYRGVNTLGEEVAGSDLGVLAWALSPESTQGGLGVDAAGNLYFVWLAEDRLPYLATSTDGGSTWSDPIMVAPPGVRQASLPDVAAGADGKVAIAYYGSTNAPGRPFPDETLTCALRVQDTCVAYDERDVDAAYADTTWNGYLTVSATVLSDEPLLYSASVNDPADPFVRGRCGSIRCPGAGDFLDVQIGPDGTAWAAFVDTCVVDVCGEFNLGNPGVVGWISGGPSLR